MAVWLKRRRAILKHPQTHPPDIPLEGGVPFGEEVSPLGSPVDIWRDCRKIAFDLCETHVHVCACVSIQIVATRSALSWVGEPSLPHQVALAKELGVVPEGGRVPFLSLRLSPAFGKHSVAGLAGVAGVGLGVGALVAAVYLRSTKVPIHSRSRTRACVSMCTRARAFFCGARALFVSPSVCPISFFLAPPPSACEVSRCSSVCVRTKRRVDRQGECRLERA